MTTPNGLEDLETLFPHAFMAKVFAKEGWTAPQHASALRGFFMRQHSDAEHPEATARTRDLCLERLDRAMHEAWLFGYEFRDTAPAAGGDGVGNERGGGSGAT